MAPPKCKTDLSQLSLGGFCDSTLSSTPDKTPAKPSFDKSKMGAGLPLREGATSNPYTDYFLKDQYIASELKKRTKIDLIEELRKTFSNDEKARKSTIAHL